MPRQTTRTRKKPAAPQPLKPEAYYPLRTFFAHSGVGPQTALAARKAGLPLPTDTIGRVKFVRGEAGIEWLQQLAASRVRTYRSETFNQDQD